MIATLLLSEFREIRGKHKRAVALRYGDVRLASIWPAGPKPIRAMALSLSSCNRLSDTIRRINSRIRESWGIGTALRGVFFTATEGNVHV